MIESKWLHYSNTSSIVYLKKEKKKKIQMNNKHKFNIANNQHFSLEMVFIINILYDALDHCKKNAQTV